MSELIVAVTLLAATVALVIPWPPWRPRREKRSDPFSHRAVQHLLNDQPKTDGEPERRSS
jgi:hypothetical protein